jgi:hypothetical protein
MSDITSDVASKFISATTSAVPKVFRSDTTSAVPSIPKSSTTAAVPNKPNSVVLAAKAFISVASPATVLTFDISPATVFMLVMLV